MTRSQYIRYLASLTADAASAVRDQGEMHEIDAPEEPVDIADVLNFTNRIRERLLWIERAAHDIKAEQS